MAADDPFAVLGLAPDASPDEAAAAYKGLAKRLHPDRAGRPDAQRRMAELNAAYEQVRRRRPGLRSPRPEPGGQDAPPSPAVHRPPPAHWLPEPVRRALGRELAAALAPGEPVTLVTPAATWASPRALLAVTDRRLLWLHDDAVSGRVRQLRLDVIAEAQHGLSWPRRRVAVVRLRTKAGRRLAFAGLRPDTAATIAHLAGGTG
jgi:hypothetical protein